jgi:hypothetical protein
MRTLCLPAADRSRDWPALARCDGCFQDRKLRQAHEHSLAQPRGGINLDFHGNGVDADEGEGIELASMNLWAIGGYKNPIPIEADGSMLPDNSGALKCLVTPLDGGSGIASCP